MAGGRSPKAKGDAYERAVVAYLKSRGVQCERAKRGNATGDILGCNGLVLECKNQRKFDPSAWITQLEREVEEAKARLGVVIAKRPRRTDVGEHYMILSVEDGLRLLKEAGYV